MFTAKFKGYVSEGDKITCVVDGFTVTARIERDDSGDRPDDRDEGFWPSKDEGAAGWVEPDNFDEAQAKAEERMKAWENDEWFYVGVCVTVERENVLLTGKYNNSLWGVESDAGEYLTEVANELLDEALGEARSKIEALCKA